MSKPIKLGKKNGKNGSPLVQALAGLDNDDDGSPRLHIDGHDDPRLLEMPDHGEAKIKYSVKHRHHEESDEGGGKKKHRYSVSLAVHHIEPPEKGKKQEA